jgi:integrase
LAHSRLKLWEILIGSLELAAILAAVPTNWLQGKTWRVQKPRVQHRRQFGFCSKAMAKKRVRKRQAWNKGLEVGKRDGFTSDQVKQIRGLLADRGVRGLRDLALFSTAIDTMLHGQDLLSLVVGDVQRRDGSIRPVIEVARARGMPPVRCALSRASTMALKKWITASGKLIDGQAPEDKDATLLALAGLDEIDAVALISDLKTLKTEMEANALGDQAGAADNSKAIVHLNSSNEARSGVTWTK